MVPTSRHETARILAGGVVSGIVGGLVLAALLVLLTWLAGRDAWVPLKCPAVPLLDRRATMPGFDAVAVAAGLGIHLVVSVLWAIPFALIVDGLPRGSTVAAGAFWGVLVFMGMFYLVLPLAGVTPVLQGGAIAIPLFEHIVFGLALGIGYLPYQRTRTGPIQRAY